MTLRVKDWHEFQHYKSGRGAPPWIKLYRKLLDDKEWYSLEPEAAKFLISIWILVAETDGILPASDLLAFRLRISSKDVAKNLSLCSHWIIDDASNVLADCYQLATPETETETETEKKTPCANPTLTGAFENFWQAYPKKKSKGDAERAWKKIKPDEQLQRRILSAVESSKNSMDWRKEGGQFIPFPATWLNAKGWEDEQAPAMPRMVAA